MKRNVKIYLVVVCMVLGALLILKINNDENEILISKDIVHGTYTEKNNKFVTLSFDVNKRKI